MSFKGISLGSDINLREEDNLSTRNKWPVPKCPLFGGFTVEEITSEYSELKRKFEESRKQLCCARQALRDVTNEKLLLQKQRDAVEKKAEKFKKLHSEYRLLEEEFMHLQEENLEISTAVAALEKELASVSDDKTTTVNDIAELHLSDEGWKKILTYNPKALL